MVARRYPDDREEHGVQLTFERFVTSARERYLAMQDKTLTVDEEDNAAKKFLQFVLAGRTEVEDTIRHVTLNACQGLAPPYDYAVSRDYDSLIGVSYDLPYTCHLAINPVPPFRDTLFKHNHMKSLAYRDVSHTYIHQSTNLNMAVTLY